MERRTIIKGKTSVFPHHPTEPNVNGKTIKKSAIVYDARIRAVNITYANDSHISQLKDSFCLLKLDDNDERPTLQNRVINVDKDCFVIKYNIVADDISYEMKIGFCHMSLLFCGCNLTNRLQFAEFIIESIVHKTYPHSLLYPFCDSIVPFKKEILSCGREGYILREVFNSSLYLCII